MKLLLIGLLSFVSLSVFSQDYNSCCFCVTDSYEDKSITNECKKNLRKNKQCDLKRVISKNEYKRSLGEGFRCKEATVYGAFHGTSSMHELPFDISAWVASVYTPEKINYDGSTCMIFNNIDDVKKNTLRLASKFPDTKFSISGNQNIGVVMHVPLLSKPKESESMSSKLTVSSYEGVSKIEFADCTKKAKRCALAHFWNRSDVASTNTKLCALGEKLVKQTCCPTKRSRKTQYGKWSAPGKTCQ